MLVQCVSHFYSIMLKLFVNGVYDNINFEDILLFVNSFLPVQGAVLLVQFPCAVLI